MIKAKFSQLVKIHRENTWCNLLSYPGETLFYWEIPKKKSFLSFLEGAICFSQQKRVTKLN